MRTKDLKYILEKFNDISKPEPLRPITSFVEMYCKDGIFRIGISDNYTKLIATLIDHEDMDNIVLDREQLLKILKLTNKEDVKFIRKDGYVALRGCGNYKLPIQTDEAGNEIQLNLAMPKLLDGKIYPIEDIKTIYSRNSVCLGSIDGYECLNYYYYEGGKVFTTDSVKACTTLATLPQKYTTSKLIKQLSMLDKDYVFSKVEHGARIDCDIFEMYFMYKDIEEYPIDVIRCFMGTEWATFSFKLDKSELVNALKRIAIFTKPWQEGKIILTFDNECVTILNENQDANESIPVKLISGTPNRLILNSEKLLDVLKRVDNDFMLYGSSKCIGLEDKTSLYVLSVMEE